MWLSGHAMPFMSAAVRRHGLEVLAERRIPAGDDERDALGGRLFRLIFGDGDPSGDLAGALAALRSSPGSQGAGDALEELVGDALENDAQMKAAVTDALAAFYRGRAGGGDVQAMADLGDMLFWEYDFEGARAAYQQAIDAGKADALIDLAHLLDREDDTDGARQCLGAAIGSGDAELSARALVTLGQVLERRDPPAAQAALQAAIETGHPDWAPAAMSDLGDLRERQGDHDGARAAYQLAIGSGHPTWAGEASFSLASLLEEHGDAAGARAEYQRVIDSGDEGRGWSAARSLAAMLQDENDLDGLRALHRTAVETGNSAAPDVLAAIGEVLEQRGDEEGARAAYQGAIDAGYYFADSLIEKLSPSPRPGTDELDALPPQVDPRNMMRTGIHVLDHGLPELPPVLSYLMVIPVAYWTAQHCAVVLFLRFMRQGRQHVPMALQVIYSRDGDAWIPPERVAGTGFSHDPIASPGGRRDLGGQAMVQSGGSWAEHAAPGHPAAVAEGRATPSVTHIALIQDGHADKRRLDSRFGAWVVCTERPGPFQVEGLDENGAVLARMTPAIARTRPSS